MINMNNDVSIVETINKDDVRKYKKSVMSKIIEFYIENDVDYKYLANKANVSIKDLALISSGYTAKDSKDSLKNILAVITKDKYTTNESVGLTTNFVNCDTSKKQILTAWVNNSEFKSKKNWIMVA